MQEPRRSALIVAYAFPPNAAVGSMRPLRWCRWLPRVSHWDCAVLTVDKEPIRRDDSLLDQLPAGLPVIRTPIHEPHYWVNPPDRPHEPWRRVGRGLLSLLREPLNTPDAQCLWHRTLVPVGQRVIEELHIDVVIATAPPWSSLLAAARLARAASVPLVLDFRDPWAEIERRGLPRWRADWKRRAEREVCAQAAVVISTSYTYSRNLARRCPEAPAERFVTLHNGFDEEAFAAASRPGIAPTDLTVVHLGKLYSRCRPFAALAGMRRWLDEHPDRRDALRLVFVGDIDGVTREALTAHGLRSICEITGHLSHAAAIARCRTADLLLLAMGDTASTPAGWIPSKLFEYLAVGRPVLAHTVDGEAAALLRESGAAALVAGDDPPAFAAALEQHWRAKQQRREPVPHTNVEAVVNRLRQEVIAPRLAQILDRAVETPR